MSTTAPGFDHSSGQKCDFAKMEFGRLIASRRLTWSRVGPLFTYLQRAGKIKIADSGKDVVVSFPELSGKTSGKQKTFTRLDSHKIQSTLLFVGGVLGYDCRGVKF